MQKWSINPKSDMQTLKVHDDLFKKGYWTKGAIYYYYCWVGAFKQQHSVQPRQLGLKTTSSANEGSTVQLSALVSFTIDYPGLSTTFIVFIHIQRFSNHRKIICRFRCAAGKPQGIHWVSESQSIFRMSASSSSIGSLYCLEWLSAISLLIQSSY